MRMNDVRKADLDCIDPYRVDLFTFRQVCFYEKCPDCKKHTDHKLALLSDYIEDLETNYRVRVEIPVIYCLRCRSYQVLESLSVGGNGPASYNIAEPRGGL